MSTEPPAYTKGLLVTTWLVTALSTISLGARLYTRYWRFSKFYWDDLFVVLAWILSIPMAAQVTVASKHNTVLHTTTFYKSVFLSRPITQLFFYNVLWAIKISFLIFFRRIGVVALPAVKRYWTVVFILTIAAYLGGWLLNPYDCWVKKGLSQCDHDPAVSRFTPIALTLATAFDVITDALIVAIPFAILSHMRLALRQKMILYSIFSFELVTMLVAIVRVIIAARGIARDRMFQITLLLFLSHIEANTAIIVACAGTLRSLFTQKGDTRSETPAPWDSRPPNNDIVRPPQAATAFKKTPSSRISERKVPDEEELSSLTKSHHSPQPSKPFETDIPIDLGDLLKKP
ncbi:uncharacterized protein CC84DRAFT_1260959 [Paraphaeosphaeria sporulosa]|uniref:Rhodopsin domain-containing protein n=1 Tax=Paraphaeosphaeria sporulosa TaxID=1460663 RepID=A0A177C9W5_9PLEO|nr:uncharacterized protein CC84DRAFT_1260959 [Paraphaeosphaeria sporulosa]OAG03911.1 hypothetical protein CC84DRAFT_1260959 [Paraphaeosphaeria sporulosa]